MGQKESSQPSGSTAQLVMKICLLVSIAVGGLIIILAVVGDRSVLEESAFVIPVVALQWFFYLALRRKPANSPE